MSTSVPWKRIIAEFVAISAGVFLGLAADDYRDQRNERHEEQDYLRLLERDLRSDSAALDYTLGLSEQESASRLLRRFRRQDQVPLDSVETAVTQLFVSWSYEQPRPTFLSLRDSGNLSIIRDAALRAALTEYFEIAQVRLQVYVAEYRFWQQRVRLGLSRYTEAFPTDEFDSYQPVPPPTDFIRLEADWGEVSADRELWNDITEVGVRVDELVRVIGEMFTENERLRTSIQSWLRQTGSA